MDIEVNQSLAWLKVRDYVFNIMVSFFFLSGLYYGKYMDIQLYKDVGTGKIRSQPRLVLGRLVVDRDPQYSIGPPRLNL